VISTIEAEDVARAGWGVGVVLWASADMASDMSESYASCAAVARSGDVKALSKTGSS
jgi:hypothetical protein